MKVFKINSNLSFGRSLREDETAEFKKTLKEGKKLAGQTGNSIFIMPSTSLPQSEMLNTGVGNLTSKETSDYLDYMKTYIDFNVVQDLPAGGFDGNHYNGSSLALGDQNINPQLLTTDEYGKILTNEEFNSIVKANSGKRKDEIANFENVTGKKSTQNNVLKKAFERFNKLDGNSELKQKYSKFTEENKEWLNFKREQEPDQEFFKFKQFLAEEHHKKGIQNLHEKGLKSCGDIAINFSDDEVKAFPDAFKQGHYIGVPGWKIPSLNYDTILDENSDAYKLLKMKFQLAAKRNDMIRVDAAWNYVTPVITPEGETKILEHNKKKMGSDLLNLIEKWVKEVKGEDFDLHNIIYEFDAGPDDFTAFENGQLIEPLRGRVKVYGSTYMGEDWGSNDAFLNHHKWSPDEFVIGAGNHDPQPLRQIANGVPDVCNFNNVHKNKNINPLARILNIPADVLNNPVEFAKAKFAEITTAKNNMFFFMDVFGREERFNQHSCESGGSTVENFRYKIPSDYKKAFQNSLNEGYGYNIMDSLAKIFKAKGLDKTNSDLYEKIVKFKNILEQKEFDVVDELDDLLKTGEDIEDDIVKLVPVEDEMKNTVKWYHSPKKLFIAAGILAAAGGAYTIYKNHHKKDEKTDKVYA